MNNNLETATVIRQDKELTEADKKLADSGVPVLRVVYNPQTETFAFFAYGALTVLLENGANVEQYLVEKLAEARRRLIKQN